jgi:tetratricopeptide (TPR) repeat protein
VDAAFETNMHDPQQAYELAGMAHAIAGKLDSKSYTERIVIDLKARSMAHLANAERAMGDLRTASRLLQQAEDLRGEGSLDPLLEGEFLYLESSLLRAQRKLDKALRRVREARSRFEEFGERHWLCWALLGEATIHSFEGSVNASIELIRKADETCDAKAYPRQALAVRHNLAWSLMRAGRYQAALDSVAEFRGEYAQVGDRASLVRLAWLEANLFAAAKRLEDAGAKFDEAIRGFTELQLPYEVGSVSLDYALMLSESGRHAEVAKLAGDILGIFNALGVERETIAAWLLFRNSSEAGAVTKAMIEKVAAYFRRAKLGQPRH